MREPVAATVPSGSIVTCVAFAVDHDTVTAPPDSTLARFTDRAAESAPVGGTGTTTVTDTGAEVVEAPRLSIATAVNVYAPAAAPGTLHEYGLVASVASSTPF
jgi:hypothetical protein